MSTSKGIQGIKVECYSGYKVDERPVSFISEGKKLKVYKIIEQWRTPDADHFKVMADDGKGYLLLHNNVNDNWEIQFCS